MEINDQLRGTIVRTKMWMLRGWNKADWLEFPQFHLQIHIRLPVPYSKYSSSSHQNPKFGTKLILILENYGLQIRDRLYLKVSALKRLFSFVFFFFLFKIFLRFFNIDGEKFLILSYPHYPLDGPSATHLLTGPRAYVSDAEFTHF